MSADGEAEKDVPVELTALVILGWVLPIVGYAWGPGEGWEYAIWLAIGTALIILWVRLHPGVIDFTPRDDAKPDE
jgi:hypothetical protein